MGNISYYGSFSFRPALPEGDKWLQSTCGPTACPLPGPWTASSSSGSTSPPSSKDSRVVQPVTKTVLALLNYFGYNAFQLNKAANNYFKHFSLKTERSKKVWEEWQRSTRGISPAKEINRRLLDTFALHNQLTLLVSPDSAMCWAGAAVGIFPLHLQQLQQHPADTRLLKETQRTEQQITKTPWVRISSPLPRPWPPWVKAPSPGSDSAVGNLKVSVLLLGVLSWKWGPGSYPSSSNSPHATTIRQSFLLHTSSYSATDEQGITLLPPPRFNTSFKPPPLQGSILSLCGGLLREQKEVLTVNMCMPSP